MKTKIKNLCYLRSPAVHGKRCRDHYAWLIAPITRFLAILSLSLVVTACAVSPALLPMVDSVPASQATDIDGVWRLSVNGAKVRIQGGRAYAVDGWQHLTFWIYPNMVVTKDIKPDGAGGYSGYDLVLLGNWQARPAADGALDVHVASAIPVSLRLLPVELDNPDGFEGGDSFDDDDYSDGGQPDEEPDYRTPPPPAISPIDGARLVGGTVAQVGRNCYRDFEPMGKAMLKYQACQMGLGNFNALKRTLAARKAEDAKNILAAKACINEFNNLVNTVRHKGFKSLSLGVSGELGAIIGGSGEAFLASNLDLSSPTMYGSLGAGIGSQVGGGLNGVVSVYYDKADKLSGKGKSFSVSLKALGGAGGSVGLSSGRSPRCESFSATAGAGAEVNAGSVSTTRTFKLIRLPKPDFTAACKDVSVRATNRTGKQIKIIDVDFYDYVNKRWRSKIIKNKKVANGRTWAKKLRLQKVGGDKTKLRVQYRVNERKGLFNKWSKVKNRITGAKTCRAGITFATDIR
ncbi:hypothetical protein [Methylomarinum vadi]|uniref:hypothetical protein n=1 Tax=Methylomarinum vadi TaxID=438855 RepID=UPI0004DEF505|nr:hypothetical protein [Methylomarinum vadi]